MLYIVCNTNQYGVFTSSVTNMQQEAIWHIFLFCNICDKKRYGVTFVYSTKILHLFLFFNICNKEQYDTFQNLRLLMYKLHIMSAPSYLQTFKVKYSMKMTQMRNNINRVW